MSYELCTILLSIFGIGFSLNASLTKQIESQNIRIEKLYDISSQNWDSIREITNYIKLTEVKLTALEKDVAQVEANINILFENNGYLSNRNLVPPNDSSS
jgi:hypothetical protein